MLFADVDLAARTEGAECSLLRDGAAAIRARLRSDSATATLADEVLVEDLGGGVAKFTVDSSPLNKVAGLGFGTDLVESDMAQIEAAFDARG